MRWGPSISRTVQRARYLIVNRVRTGRYVLAAWIKPKHWAPGDPGPYVSGWRDHWDERYMHGWHDPRHGVWSEADRAERHKVAANRYRTPPSPCSDPWCSPGDGCILAADHPPDDDYVPHRGCTDDPTPPRH